jgi:hypothetical protein
MDVLYSRKQVSIIVGLLLFPYSSFCQAPILLSHSPATNVSNAPLDSRVELTFSQSMSSQAANKRAIRVVSGWRGQLAGSYTGAGSSIIRFTPSARLLPSEPISVTVTALTTSQAGTPVANTSSYGFTATAGGASGQFTEAPTTPIAPRVYDLALADIDRDGAIDMLTANISAANTGVVNVRLGDGKGGYRKSSDISLGGKPSSVVVGDINKDGNLDFIATNGDVSTASVRLGDGAGGFGTAPEVAVGQHPVQGQLQDVNKDGNLDLITVSDGTNAISLRFGDGTGKFILPTLPFKAEIATGVTPIGLVVRDINRDGSADLLTVGQGTGRATATSSTCLGDGRGGFLPAVTTDLKVYVNGLALQDVNADGNPDLLLTSPTSAYHGRGTVNIRLGDGKGAFLGTGAVRVNKDPTRVITGDFNRDGKVDLATIGRNYVTSYSTISIRLGDGTGAFSGYTDYPFGSITATNIPTALVAAADVDGDSNADLVYISNTYVNYATSTTTVMSAGSKLGNGQGSFAGASELVSGNTADVDMTRVAVADLNNDGSLDLLCEHTASNGVGVKLNDGRGNFTTGPTVTLPTGTSPYSIATGDLNGDGNVDFVTANYGLTSGVGGPAGGQSVSVRLGVGNGTFSGATELALPTFPYQVLLSDVNNDGKLDMLVTTYSNYNFVYVKLGDGNGGFTDATPITDGVGTGMNLVAVDINNDGLIDLVSADRDNYNQRMHSYLGDGRGGFKSKAFISTYGTPVGVAAGDVNGDGFLDFVVPTTYPALSTYLGDGKGGLTRGSNLVLSSSSVSAIALADMNGDGFLDAIVGGLTSGTRVFSGDGKGSFAYTASVSTGNYVLDVVPCDINRDGSLDLLTSCEEEEAVSIRLSGVQMPAVLAVLPSKPLEDAARLTLYPNPSRDKITLKNVVLNTAVTLLDMTGRVVRSYPSAAVPLDITGLVPGLYLVRCDKQTSHLVVE